MRRVLPLTIGWLVVVVAFASAPALGQTQAVFDQGSLRDRGGLLPAQAATLLSRRDLIVGEASRASAPGDLSHKKAQQSQRLVQSEGDDAFDPK